MPNIKAFIIVTALFIFFLFGLSTVKAQTPADRLSALIVDLWPDYDQPAMLVLLTGELPADAPLPATITIPLPAGADLNAVARYGETGGLFSDVEYVINDNQLTITTPSPRFRVEYYAPYRVDGNTHAYTFDWTGDLAIDSLSAVVQQPLGATFITTDPPSTGSELRNDDLTYYRLPAQPLSPGQRYAVQVNYDMPSPQLSVDALQTGAAAPHTTATTSPIVWWVLGVVGVAVVIGGAFYLGRGSASSARRRKPSPSRPAKAKSSAGRGSTVPGSTVSGSKSTPTVGKAPEKPNAASPPSTTATTARYCHQCGQSAESGDVYCRNCGTKLK
jgi:hypothetical protein